MRHYHSQCEFFNGYIVHIPRAEPCLHSSYVYKPLSPISHMLYWKSENTIKFKYSSSPELIFASKGGSTVYIFRSLNT